MILRLKPQPGKKNFKSEGRGVLKNFKSEERGYLKRVMGDNDVLSVSPIGDRMDLGK